VSITVEDATVSGAYRIIGNLPDYSMTLSLTPGARADDGVLD
jgi:hypothetical protein